MSERERLVSRRAALQLSQADLARIASVNKSTVWRWEAGTRKVPAWLDVVLDTLEQDQGHMVTSLAWLLKLRASKKGA